jgi:hypothetical protein
MRCTRIVTLACAFVSRLTAAQQRQGCYKESQQARPTPLSIRQNKWNEVRAAAPFYR